MRPVDTVAAMGGSLADIPSHVICEAAEPATPLPDGCVLARAPAKLNLVLRVGPIRGDGFHPLDSIVAKVTLYDDLVFGSRRNGAITLSCNDVTVGDGEDNLVCRAARLLRSRWGGAGVDIRLHKRIPAGAGLGGGSADAAITLRVLDKLWGLGVAEADLAALAAELGSDVPLTLGPPAARMRGRGEVLTPVQVAPFAAVLITPPVHCPTAAVYRAFDALSPGPLASVDPSAFASRPATQWAELLSNDLLAPACRVCPDVGAWLARLRAATGQAVHMTGSGSGLFILADDLPAAACIYRRLDGEAAAYARIVVSNPW